jgi:uncharacterized RDD family membrane protein YckC
LRYENFEPGYARLFIFLSQLKRYIKTIRMPRKTYFDESNLVIADKFSRFCNFFVDQIAFMLIIFLHAMLLDGVLGIIPKDGSPWLGLYSIVLYIFYYSLFEFYFGKTPGKFFTRTVVVTKDGQRATFKILLIRSLCRLIPFDALSFLFLSDWHDDLSRTVVINDRH